MLTSENAVHGSFCCACYGVLLLIEGLLVQQALALGNADAGNCITHHVQGGDQHLDGAVDGQDQGVGQQSAVVDEALTEQLLQINPYLCYEPHFLKLTPQNIPEIFAGCNIICEAFDDPEQKAMLTETVLQRLPQAKLIVCSGMAGAGSANAITTSRRLNRFYLCGDGTADIAADGSLLAPRVSVCAAHAATMVMRLALGFTTP